MRAIRPDTPNLCLVCGLDLVEFGADEPWGPTGDLPSFDICPCCGTEFGYEDFTLDAVRASRIRWIGDGRVWRDAGSEPAGWDVTAQLAKLPETAR